MSLSQALNQFAQNLGRYRMKTESVYPEHWEKRTRDEVLVLIDEYIHWYNHERIKQSLGWMSPVQYRQSQGMAA